MPKLVLTNANVTLAGTDISSYVKQVTLTSSVNEVETTAFGSTARTRVAGLTDNKVQLDIHQDYAAGAVEPLVYPLIGGTAVTMVVKPNGSATSTANPSYTFSVLVTEWTPVNGAVGDLATASVTWPVSGAITKALS